MYSVVICCKIVKTCFDLPQQSRAYVGQTSPVAASLVAELVVGSPAVKLVAEALVELALPVAPAKSVSTRPFECLLSTRLVVLEVIPEFLEDHTLDDWQSDGRLSAYPPDSVLGDALSSLLAVAEVGC